EGFFSIPVGSVFYQFLFLTKILPGDWWLSDEIHPFWDAIQFVYEIAIIIHAYTKEYVVFCPSVTGSGRSP
ncbi:MAG TPA: hypothetical protein VFZ23_15715, partial [Pyrinomonadaceae bacterium]